MLGYCKAREVVTCVIEVWPLARLVSESTTETSFALSGDEGVFLQSDWEESVRFSDKSE